MQFYYKNLVFEVPECVYYPAEDSLLLAAVVEKESLKGKRILDIGTGCGFIAIIAALHGARVDACDINPAAVEAARKNAAKNGVKIAVFISDLYDKVKGKYDIIIFNPPYLPEGEEDAIAGKDVAYAGGISGAGIIVKFIGKLPRHLSGDGKALFVSSSLADMRRVHAAAKNAKVKIKTMARKKLWWEELQIMQAKAYKQ